MPSPTCDYSVIGGLGAGGMGEVVKARHRVGFELAVKKALPGHEERMARETEALRILQHPGIVGLCPGIRKNICSVPRDGHLCLELLVGQTCQEIGQSRDWAQALYVTKSAAETLQHIHSVGWMHRDVKPSNVFWTRTGAIKLIDFGLSRKVGGSAEEAEKTRTGAGTPAYMAPEQFYENPTRHKTEVDCFALGGLLYFLLVGRAPPRDLVNGDWEIPKLQDSLEKLESPTAEPILLACQQLIERCTRTRASDRISAADVIGVITRVQKEHDLFLNNALPHSRSLRQSKKRGAQRMTVVPPQVSHREAEAGAGDPEVLLPAREPHHHVLLESGLHRQGKFLLKSIPELAQLRMWRNAWLQPVSQGVAGLVSDYFLRRMQTRGGPVEERTFARFTVCELLSPSLTMLQQSRGLGHKKLGCRVSALRGQIPLRDGGPITHSATTLCFFVADMEASGNVEVPIVSIHLVHDYQA